MVQPSRSNRLFSFETLHRTLPILVIIAMVIVVFGRVTEFDFVEWDDTRNLAENPLLRAPSWQAIVGYFKSPFFDLYIPVSYFVWSLVAWVSMFLQGSTVLNPATFHLSNLCLHTINAILVYLLAHRIFQSRAACLISGLIFALHPLQVEPVAWASGLRDLFSALFSLLALHQIIGINTQRWWRHAAFFIICFTIALFSKPSASCLPMVAALILWYHGGNQIKRCNLALLAFCFFVILPLVGWTFRMQYDPTSFVPPPLWQRPFVACDALLFYAGKLFFPWPLIPDYGRMPLVVLSSPWCYATPLWLLIPFLLWLWRARSFRAPILFVAISLAALMPNLGMIPFNFQRVSTVADRYFYLAMLGPALGTAALLHFWPRRSLFSLFTAVIAFMAAVSVVQLSHWRSTTALFTYTLVHNPRSLSALNNLGSAAISSNDLAAAEEYLHKALSIKPDSYHALGNLGIVSQHLGRTQEAISILRQAESLDPRQPLSHVNLADALQSAGRFDEALAQYREALRLDPDNYLANNNIGSLLERLGQSDEAGKYYEKATSLSISPILALYNLGLLLHKRGHHDEALKMLKRALTEVAACAPAQQPLWRSRILNVIALTYYQQGKLNDAWISVQDALHETPGNGEIHYNAGLIQRASEQKIEAIRSMEHAEFPCLPPLIRGCGVSPK